MSPRRVQSPGLRSTEMAARRPRPSGWISTVREGATVSTDLGALVIGNCIDTLRQVPDSTIDLVITSPPYDGQPRR